MKNGSEATKATGSGQGVTTFDARGNKRRQCRRELKCAPVSEGTTEHSIASVIGDDLAANQSAELCGGVARKAPNVCGLVLRDLTFEVRRDRRWDARPARPMITNTVARAWWPAVGPRLD